MSVFFGILFGIMFVALIVSAFYVTSRKKDDEDEI